MADNNIRIEHISVSRLYEFAVETIDKAEPGDFIPITLHRAMAMSKNPHAKPDDVALLVAYSGAQIVGYFGIMTVKIQHGGKLDRAQWFTTWMVSPNYTGRGVGSKLMQAALDLEQDYFIIGSKPARRVCDKFDFKRLAPYEFSVIDFRVAYRYNPVSLLIRGVRKILTALKIRINFSKLIGIPASLFERLFGAVLRPVLYALTMQIAKKGLPAYEIRYVDQVKSPAGSHERDSNITQLIRGDEVVNWMLSEPWVLQPGQSKTESLDYYFSDTRPLFELFAIEIHTADYRGYVAYQFSKIGENRVLKVLDVNMKSQNDYGLVLAATLEVAKKKYPDQIDIASKFVEGISPSLLGKVLLTRKQRICQVHPNSDDSPLGQAWSELTLSIVDGDTAFS